MQQPRITQNSGIQQPRNPGSNNSEIRNPATQDHPKIRNPAILHLCRLGPGRDLLPGGPRNWDKGGRRGLPGMQGRLLGENNPFPSAASAGKREGIPGGHRESSARAALREFLPGIPLQRGRYPGVLLLGTPQMSPGRCELPVPRGTPGWGGICHFDVTASCRGILDTCCKPGPGIWPLIPGLTGRWSPGPPGSPKPPSPHRSHPRLEFPAGSPSGHHRCPGKAPLEGK